MARRIALLALVLAVLLFGAGACLFGGGDDDEPTPTPTTTTAPATRTATTPPGTATTPAGTPGTTPTATGPRTYTVQPGDTLSAIAQQFGVTVEAIAAANGIEDPDFIDVGQVLLIPEAQTE